MKTDMRALVPLENVSVEVFRLPFERPESDGTIVWDATTMVLVHVDGGGQRGIGYTYGATAVAQLIRELLVEVVRGRDAFAIPGIHAAMRQRVRNAGGEGVASMAISAVDIALWDLQAKLLDLPLARLLGTARSAVPVYASGGFTSMPIADLVRGTLGWRARGFDRMKMKVGREAAADIERVRAVRRAVGDDVEIFVDANGAYSRKDALFFAEAFLEQGVTYFEEPVSSDDLAGLRLLRDRAPAPIAIAAGEYAWGLKELRGLLEGGCVDILQADATRCGGITGFLAAGALADAFAIPLSSHCAPTVHLAAASAVPRLAHLEWFDDHQRMELALFDGVVDPIGGAMHPAVDRPGLGITLKTQGAEKYRV